MSNFGKPSEGNKANHAEPDPVMETYALERNIGTESTKGIPESETSSKSFGWVYRVGKASERGARCRAFLGIVSSRSYAEAVLTP